MKYLYPELMILVGCQNWFDNDSNDEMIQYWYTDRKYLEEPVIIEYISILVILIENVVTWLTLFYFASGLQIFKIAEYLFCKINNKICIVIENKVLKCSKLEIGLIFADSQNDNNYIQYIKYCSNVFQQSVATCIDICSIKFISFTRPCSVVFGILIDCIY